MPKAFDILKQKIAKNLKGKINPRTKKPYTDSEIWAIAVSQWKKTHGGKAPSREESPQWYCTDCGDEVRENVELQWFNEITEFVDETFNENQPFRIKGISLVPTISRNNIEYVVDEIKKATPGLIGKPLIDSHKGSESVDRTLGKVIDSYFEDNKSKFVAEIDPSEKKIISKIRNGYINKVSIAGRVKKLIKKTKELEDGSEYEYYKAEGLSLEELSLVTFPGIMNTSVKSLENALHESFNTNFDDNKSIMEDVKMNEEIEALRKEVQSLKEKEGLNPEKLTSEISQNILKLLNEKDLEGQRSKLSETIKERGLEMDLSSLNKEGLSVVEKLLALREEDGEEEETPAPEEETSPEEALNGSKGVTANVTEQDDVKELMEKCKYAVIKKGADGMEYYEVRPE